MVLSGVAAFAVYFVKSSLDNLILACVFGAVSTMGFNALDCLGAELFPTHLRFVPGSAQLDDDYLKFLAALCTVCHQFALPASAGIPSQNISVP